MEIGTLGCINRYADIVQLALWPRPFTIHELDVAKHTSTINRKDFVIIVANYVDSGTTWSLVLSSRGAAGWVETLYLDTVQGSIDGGYL